MRIYFKTFFIVACVMAVTYVLSACVCCKQFVIPGNALNIFFGLFGVLYAIIIGFAIFEVLNNYNEIKEFMNSEVNELQDLRDYLMYVDGQDEVKQEIGQHIKKYAQAVVNKEWPAMCSYKKLDIDTPEEMYDVMKSVNKIKPANDSDVMALEKLIDTIGTVTTHRTNRITASVEKLPSLLVQLIFILSAFMIVIFALIPIDALIVKMALTAINTFGIAFIYFVIKDLDYPFGGIWSIKPEPFKSFIARFKD